MSHPNQASATAASGSRPAGETASDKHAMDNVSPRAAIVALFIRLHFYIGIFVGPFIFIAALTGTLYVLTPQIENRLYSHQLFTESQGTPHSLSEQIHAAQAWLAHRQDAKLLAVRPAPVAGATTRVMFTLPELGPSESRAVFIDPVSLENRGSEIVYGTSGILPFRIWLDYLHRGLLLGDVGRNYSELAASWLWVAALGGMVIWWSTRHLSSATKRRRLKNSQTTTAKTQRLRHWHATMGLTLVLGLLFFSVTGLTWSQWAGSNISVARTALGWQTPSVNTQLPTPMSHHDMMHGHDMAMTTDEHAEHHASMPMENVEAASPALFDEVLAAARNAGIDANKIEIRPATKPHRAWTVSEIDRSWPTQVDAVSVNPDTLEIIDKTDFNTFPLAAKLTRWGVDAHMGVLFGLPNQLILAAFGLGLCTMIVWGYRMWWIRRPKSRHDANPVNTLTAALLRVPLFQRVLIALITLLLAVSLPVMGISLLIFLLIDVVRWYMNHPKQTIAKS
ncbi:PepSY domain-containing protein [Pectobacterium brasiliense]|uniref:PepSY domain-containing protein n=1 Tax=Pectobacterium brasiliense TaxID=180957 RepID=A0AAE2WF29_9GAMM|nr:PepSY-associated TM helix domain-containing protein [Pectobacterium brasiliense]MBA0219076.1 PepSY domain-containing protein [Pectobacterium brasiliense]MBN3051437.1 PepSY domain-containing protein [Pectobacterium brasiliense]MBN3072062.1 PepSY domain-containing protein [Pectobacterium brasiliense]MBN3170222.1 PepSY domain-containing protein [Pectobacterium brasiliense]